MPDQLQLRGGTTTEHNSFTGVSREVTVDTTKKTLVVHDGSTAGGTPLMKESGGNSASSVAIGTGGNNALNIDSSQRVGIGTANPASLVNLSGASGACTLQLSRSNASANGNTYGNLLFTSDTDVNVARVRGVRQSAANDATLVFDTAASGSLSEKMRIESDGKVGIGTTSPSTKLDVSGGIKATTDITLASTTAGQSLIITKNGTQAVKLGHIGTGNEGLLVLKENGTDTVKFNASTGGTSYINAGNVGIGTTSPSRKLDVVGDAEFIHDNGVTIEAASTNTAGLLTIIGMNASDQISAISRIQSVSTGSNNASTNTTFSNRNSSNAVNEHMRITDSGQLLVGTTSQTSTDGVITGIKSASASRIVVGISNTTASGVAGYDMLPSNTVTGARIECRATEDFSTVANRTADLGFYTRLNGTLAEKLTILSNGNVGIGTTSPNSLLNIHGVFETNAYDSSNAQGGIYTAKGFLIGDAYNAGKGSKAGVGDDRNMCLWQERGLNVHFGVSDELAATIDVQKRFLIGNHGSSLPVWGVHGALQLTGTTWDQTSIILNNFGNNTNRGTLQFMKSKSGTVGGYGTAMGANEVIGQINWSAADTADATNLAAQIEVTSFGVPTNNNQYGRFQFKTQNGAGSTNATRFIIDNDGVKFNGDTGANNALNDYEEGSFTPTLTTQSSLLTATYHSQDGKYTKIGNFVHFQIYIRLASKSGGSGQLRISGLPFTSSAASGAAYGGAVVAYTYNWDNTALDRMMIGTGSTQVQLFVGQSSGTNTDAGAGNLNSDTQIRIFGSYRV